MQQKAVFLYLETKVKLKDLADKIIQGYEISREEALELYEAPLDLLQEGAEKITSHFFLNALELCCISNGKCGRCTEDCKFCSQSRHFKTDISESPLKTADELFTEAKYNADRGVHRFSVVTAGARLSHEEIEVIASAFRRIRKELNISCCASLGLINEADLKLLQDSGMSRYHCNIETSPAFFKEICTTHTMVQKRRTIEAAKKLGLEICSGCILGMGESVEDRVDIALFLRELKVDSTPVNILNPIPGTPLEGQPPMEREEICRSIALFRYILPKTVLRLAGGRLLIRDYFTELYRYGINAEITGDMLTTAGLAIASDIDSAIKADRVVGRIDPLVD